MRGQMTSRRGRRAGSAGHGWSHRPGGRDPGGGWPAVVESWDRRPDAHIGADRREPRPVLAA